MKPRGTDSLAVLSYSFGLRQTWNEALALILFLRQRLGRYTKAGGARVGQGRGGKEKVRSMIWLAADANVSGLVNPMLWLRFTTEP